MPSPILATKLYVPLPRPTIVLRPRLIERLNEGLGRGLGRGFRRRLTLVSAPAGFGKTTLIGEWVADCELPTAWLSLDEEDGDLVRFLTYFVAALRTIETNIGEAASSLLQSAQPPPIETILTDLLNEIADVPEDFVLILDDYHSAAAEPVDRALAFLLEHLPPRMHVVVATREEPRLPLARLRALDQMTELRVEDLRFTPSEAAEFLNRVMGLGLSETNIAALEVLTEGWIAGLQLAAISMQGNEDDDGFIESFTGSHRFVLDYLIEEVLRKQPDSVRSFLSGTSILDRMCGPLCDAVLLDTPPSGQETLEYLERANLFIVPLDNERRWYRYHHLFADSLRRQPREDAAELHARASRWYEANGQNLEAFRHAAAADDVERAERLIEGKGMPLHFRGASAMVVNWLESLPTTVLDARPSLWVLFASALSMTGMTTGVEEKLRFAERALRGVEPDDQARNLIGHIAAIRALLAATRYQAEDIIAQSRRALEYLRPDNLPVRTATIWKMGMAYQLQGDRAAAARAYAEAISISRASGNTVIDISATIGLGTVQETENQLPQAALTFRRALRLAGDSPQPVAGEAHLGLARILYEWNDLDAAELHGRQSIGLARRYDSALDRSGVCEAFLARLKLARGDVDGADAILAEAGQFALQEGPMRRSPELGAAQALLLLRRGDPAGAARVAEAQDLPLSRARARLAQGDANAALALLEPLRRQAETREWPDLRLETMIQQAIALRALGKEDEASGLLGEALALAEPGGFIRAFVDEGPPMAELLHASAARGIMPDYIGKLLAAFEPEERKREVESDLPSSRPSLALLSRRELEVLRLIAEGLSNDEIGKRLFLALDTVKGHNRKIFDKLQVKRRTEAVARARELGLL